MIECRWKAYRAREAEREPEREREGGGVGGGGGERERDRDKTGKLETQIYRPYTQRLSIPSSSRNCSGLFTKKRTEPVNMCKK